MAQSPESFNPVSFNPIMVRLLLGSPFNCSRLNLLVFQSHNGAIAASMMPLTVVMSASFQSHNGAIAATMTGDIQITPIQFQSHNGAIAAHS